jgi:lipopolysaccharide transport system ATP-binding protein
MSEIVITAENISKKYVLGNTRLGGGGFRHVLSDMVALPVRKLRQLRGTQGQNAYSAAAADGQEFWALRDVSFDVRLGEIVGIIGRNGAGKSTLLKILSRITEPTTGRVGLKGRVASLLEVGTGFHHELTGRENIFLNGSILGMKRAEIRRKLDEIVDFAGIGEFLDTPVKRYSSGMYIRLAFSVAAHLDPEILIVDEVLAVGDATFQKKCLGKMEEVSRKEGRAVLFVSHNMHAVAALTNRCLFIKAGRIVLNGSPQKVIAACLEDGIVRGDIYSSPASREAPSITRVELQTSEPNNTQVSGKPMRVMFEVSTPHPIKFAAFSLQIVDHLMQPVAQLWTVDSENPLCRTSGSYRLVCEIPRLRLYLGNYSIRANLLEGEFPIHAIEGVCPFEVVMYGQSREWRWIEGACRYVEEADWQVDRITGQG